MKLSKLLRMLLLALPMFGVGCSPKGWSVEEEGAYDPVEPINRIGHSWNKLVDGVALRPASKVYGVLPPMVRETAGNVFDNAGEISNIANNALQKKGDAAVNSTARLVFNTTFGVFGMFDVAEKMGIERADADTGQTVRAYSLKVNGFLHEYGVVPAYDGSAYLALPFLGPSTLADAAGGVGDSRLYPLTYVGDVQWRNGVTAAQAVHRRWELSDDIELAEQAALDEYSFIRDIYEERRRNEEPAEVLWFD